MLTWTIALVFLLALFAGTFGYIAAGPIVPILFVVSLPLCVWSMVQHRRDRNRGPRG